MRSTAYFWLHLIFSMIVSAGIAALYLFLFITGYVHDVGRTLWIAVGVSAVMLAILILQIHALRGHKCIDGGGEEGGCRDKNANRFLMSGLIGAMATIGFGMMAVGGFLSKDAKSTLVLVFFSALFFAFELIQSAAHACNKIK